VKRDPNIEAYRLLRRFVPELRRFVRNQLVALHGEAWVEQGVPEAIAKQWSDFERRWRDRPWVPTESESLLDFSYEDDLKTIIVWDDNWTRIFGKFFGRDKKQIEMRLEYINWVRDHIAHFRPVRREDLQQLRGFCKGIWDCIIRAAKMEADSEAPERLLPPAELLAGDKDPAELLALVQKRAAAVRRGEMQAVTEQQLAAVERSLLDLMFEQGAYPDETDVEATAIHWQFNEWERAPETEVLAWQVYAPAEPVPRGSTVYLAIRYNPAAVRARPAVKGAAKPPFDPRAQRCACQIDYFRLIGLAGRFVAGRGSFTPHTVDPQGWTYWPYTPEEMGQYKVVWHGESDPEGWENPWARAEFVVTRRRRSTARKQT